VLPCYLIWYFYFRVEETKEEEFDAGQWFEDNQTDAIFDNDYTEPEEPSEPV